MRNLIILIFLLDFFLFTHVIQTFQVSDTDSCRATLIIEIEDFSNNNGCVRSHLFNQADKFPTESDNAFRKVIGKIKNLRAELVYENIPFGTYALTTHHDEDNNGRMNRSWLGYPTEKFGLSNNPAIFLSVPGFDKCKFKIDQSIVKIRIEMKSAI